MTDTNLFFTFTVRSPFLLHAILVDQDDRLAAGIQLGGLDRGLLGLLDHLLLCLGVFSLGSHVSLDQGIGNLTPPYLIEIEFLQQMVWIWLQRLIL